MSISFFLKKKSSQFFFIPKSFFNFFLSIKKKKMRIKNIEYTWKNGLRYLGLCELCYEEGYWQSIFYKSNYFCFCEHHHRYYNMVNEIEKFRMRTDIQNQRIWTHFHQKRLLG